MGADATFDIVLKSRDRPPEPPQKIQITWIRKLEKDRKKFFLDNTLIYTPILLCSSALKNYED